jgi:hypothetical protein
MGGYKKAPQYNQDSYGQEEYSEAAPMTGDESKMYNTD